MKRNYNIADVNTKSLHKDRFLCLLFLLGFVSTNDEPVGEPEFSKMEAKEMLKQQVRLVRDEVAESTSGVSCARTNKYAKQLLRSLSIWSILQMADASVLSTWYQMRVSAFEALGQMARQFSQSPMVISVFMAMMVMFVAVMYMVPGQGSSQEPEPENEDVENQVQTASTRTVYGTSNLKVPDTSALSGNEVSWNFQRCDVSSRRYACMVVLQMSGQNCSR